MVDPEESTTTGTSGPKVLNCSICSKPILPEHGWTGGHNAHPVNNGRCCSDCNTKVVVPMRLQILLARRQADEMQSVVKTVNAVNDNE